MKRWTWTAPFYGVTHLQDVPSPWQFTVADYSHEGFSMAEGCMIHLEHISHGGRDQWFETAEEAKRWCEQLAETVL